MGYMYCNLHAALLLRFDHAQLTPKGGGVMPVEIQQSNHACEKPLFPSATLVISPWFLLAYTDRCHDLILYHQLRTPRIIYHHISNNRTCSIMRDWWQTRNESFLDNKKIRNTSHHLTGLPCTCKHMQMQMQSARGGTGVL
jgi:hypothetical protein